MTASYELEKAMQETIALQDNLIRQLGEALLCHSELLICETPGLIAQVIEAQNSYKQWKARNS